MRKLTLLACLCTLTASLALARSERGPTPSMIGDKAYSLHNAEDPVGGQRTLLLRENQFPLRGNTEWGGSLLFSEARDNNEDGDSADTVILQADYRYGIWDNVTLSASVPLGYSEGFDGSAEGGFGDIRAGLALKAFEDILEAPFIIPHADVYLPTGDEDAGLGFGETRVRLGTSFGDTIFNRWHWIGDLSYEFRSEVENAFIYSAATIFEMSDRFGFTIEGQGTDEEVGLDKERPGTLGGGMYYDWDPNLRLSFHGQAGINDASDETAVFRFTYQKIPEGTKSYENIGLPLGVREEDDFIRATYPKAPAQPESPGAAVESLPNVGKESNVDYGDGGGAPAAPAPAPPAELPMAQTFPVETSVDTNPGGTTTIGSNRNPNLPMATTYPMDTPVPSAPTYRR